MAQSNTRFVSKLTRNTIALILAGGRGTRLQQLTDWRAKPAVPFGGKFRIIDFPLSNCVNSGIRRIAVLTQYKAHSLITHIQKGWSFMRGEFQEFVELWPAQQRVNEMSWYSGTADAVYQNLDIIRTHDPEYILILAGDHIYKMDYGDMIAYHVQSGADMTVGCIEHPRHLCSEFGVMAIDADYRVRAFAEKPCDPEPMPDDADYSLVSMGIYVFNRDFLYEQLVRDATSAQSEHDFGKNIIPDVIEHYRVQAYPFRDSKTGKQAYWRDVGTLKAYWEANLELVGVTPPLDLYEREWPILTYQEQMPPAKFVFDDDERRGMATDSMVSGGCIISGATVRHSLIFSQVRIHSYSYVEDSVVLPDVNIGRNCVIKRAIIAGECNIPDNMQIGVDPDLDRSRGFNVTPEGITLVTMDMLGQNDNQFQ